MPRRHGRGDYLRLDTDTQPGKGYVIPATFTSLKSRWGGGGGWRAEARQHVAQVPRRSPRQAEEKFDLALSAQRSHSGSANAAFGATQTIGGIVPLWSFALEWGPLGLFLPLVGPLWARIPAGV